MAASSGHRASYSKRESGATPRNPPVLRAIRHIAQLNSKTQTILRLWRIIDCRVFQANTRDHSYCRELRDPETDLHALATEVARQLEDMAAARGVTIRADASLGPLVIDPARVELVLLNLVSNAIKYSDPQKPERLVEIAGAHDSTEGLCSITVRDNGLGIPDADQPAIFDRFFRAHAHLDGELGVSGTGLGLAIVVECVRELGGSIACCTAPQFVPMARYHRRASVKPNRRSNE